MFLLSWRKHRFSLRHSSSSVSFQSSLNTRLPQRHFNLPSKLFFLSIMSIFPQHFFLSIISIFPQISSSSASCLSSLNTHLPQHHFNLPSTLFFLSIISIFLQHSFLPQHHFNLPSIPNFLSIISIFLQHSFLPQHHFSLPSTLFFLSIVSVFPQHHSFLLWTNKQSTCLCCFCKVTFFQKLDTETTQQNNSTKQLNRKQINIPRIIFRRLTVVYVLFCSLN